MTLRRAVIDAFPQFSTKFEGRVPTMYADIRGLITTAIGCLIDPVSSALTLKWRYADGGLAPMAQIAAEWRALKARAAEMAHHNPPTQVKLCGLTLHLDDAEIDQLVDERLFANALVVERYFPNFSMFPADAQLGIMSLAWAAGAGFAPKFPSFTRAANAGDWATAAKEGKLNTTTPEGLKNWGVVPRNDAQVICFSNAAASIAHGLDPELLFYPNFPNAGA